MIKATITGITGLCCCILRCNLTAAQVVRAAEFDYLIAFTMMRWSCEAKFPAAAREYGRCPDGGDDRWQAAFALSVVSLR